MHKLHEPDAQVRVNSTSPYPSIAPFLPALPFLCKSFVRYTLTVVCIYIAPFAVRKLAPISIVVPSYPPRTLLELDLGKDRLYVPVPHARYLLVRANVLLSSLLRVPQCDIADECH